MRQLLLISVIAFLNVTAHSQTADQLVEICVDGLGDATYLKDFQVEHAAAVPGQQAPVARYSMVLNKNTQYRLSICTSEGASGKGIIQLFDNQGVVATNYVEDSDTYYSFFDVKIQSTGVYHIFISFKDGAPGTAVGVLSLVKR